MAITKTRMFFVDGSWVEPRAEQSAPAINPATEEPIASIAMASGGDVDAAVGAAANAADSFARTSVMERAQILNRIIEAYGGRADDLAGAISREMGAPLAFSKRYQVPAGLDHLRVARQVLLDYAFQAKIDGIAIHREAIGVCALITPWNWPVNQIAAKVAPALAAGCTMILKPSEQTPLSAVIWTEILEEAGVPRGVFNMIHGVGSEAGAGLAAHRGVAMVSFTGSTRAGVEVAIKAAPTVKRVTQELGGKSAYVVLDDADLQACVSQAVHFCFGNSGQSCNAPTRLLVPKDRSRDACLVAASVAAGVKVGDPLASDTDMGPVASRAQWEKIQGLIRSGIDDGAELVIGGLGRPKGLERGFYVKPTVFSGVDNRMTIAQEEIFGPVLCIIPYRDEAEAVEIANDTKYGLAAFVRSGQPHRGARVAHAMRAGTVHIDGPPVDPRAPFGGYKQSGNGREFGRFGLEEFLEVKAILGAGA